MDIKALARYLFSRKRTCRLGLSRSTAASVYTLLSKSQSGETDIVYTGKGLPLFIRLITPPVVYTDLGSAPVFVTTGELKDQDAEKWIDANESAIIPPGVKSDRIASEFSVSGNKIFAATVLKSVREQCAVPLEKERQFASLSAPLWNVAKLYHKTLNRPFILWRIASDGSVLGAVMEGRVERLLNCHVNPDDLKKDPVESARAIEQYVNKLARNDSEIPVVFYSHEPDFSMPDAFSLSLYRLRRAPAIKGVPESCHESYANACYGGPEMDFLPAEKSRKARKAEAMMRSLKGVVSTGTIITFALLVLLVIADLTLALIGNKFSGPMEKLEAQATIVKVSERRQRGLLKSIRGKLRFSNERSRVTTLLSDLQGVFPENAWAEEVTISLVGNDKYQCDIQAVTPESGLIGKTLETFGSTAGISDARLVSSEQVKLTYGKTVMRFKMKGLWQDKISAEEEKP